VKELLVATRNMGKMKEIRQILDGLVDRLYCLADFSDIPEVEEDGWTFEENALKKASCACRATGLPAMADDSGLVVAFLEGRPGVRSARYAGVGASDADNNRKLLADLSGFSGLERKAFFYCAVALCFPGGVSRTFCGKVDGIILEQPRGIGGFGYDPLFLVPEYGKTFAGLDLKIKNKISHRGRALDELRIYLSGI
jgi:XTP/dITP diphosphohydrolase